MPRRQDLRPARSHSTGGQWCQCSRCGPGPPPEGGHRRRLRTPDGWRPAAAAAATVGAGARGSPGSCGRTTRCRRSGPGLGRPRPLGRAGSRARRSRRVAPWPAPGRACRTVRRCRRPIAHSRCRVRSAPRPGPSPRSSGRRPASPTRGPPGSGRATAGARRGAGADPRSPANRTPLRETARTAAC